MNVKTWSPEERAEYDELLDDVCESSNVTRDRVARFLAGVDSAKQAHRWWATDVLNEIRARGAASLINAFNKARQRVFVAHDGRVLERSGVVGIKRHTPNGDVYVVQALIYTATREELLRKRSEYLSQIKAYDGNVEIVDKLLALLDLAGDCATPEDAAKKLGITVDGWLTQGLARPERKAA